MAIPVINIVYRLRSKMDNVIDQKDVLSQDGTNYTVALSAKPIVVGTDEVYLTHTTFTTGYNQYIYRNGTQDPTVSQITYDINYNRGELTFYRGSGWSPASGLAAFAPWNTSTVTAYYQKSKYTDNVLSDYVSFAVAHVESALQLGMYVSSISGVIPAIPRNIQDFVDYHTTDPYLPAYKFVIAEDVEILQELIAMRAAYDLASRERRIGAGNAIVIKDGDTQINTSVNQKYLVDFVNDIKKDYNDMLHFIMHNMLEGISLRQINESYYLRGYGSFKTNPMASYPYFE